MAPRIRRRVALAALAATALLCTVTSPASAQTPAACPSTFAVLHDDHIGALALPQGNYTITVTDPARLSCAAASDRFRQFLQDFDGVFPSPWTLDRRERDVHRRVRPGLQRRARIAAKRWRRRIAPRDRHALPRDVRRAPQRPDRRAPAPGRRLHDHAAVDRPAHLCAGIVAPHRVPAGLRRHAPRRLDRRPGDGDVPAQRARRLPHQAGRAALRRRHGPRAPLRRRRVQRRHRPPLPRPARPSGRLSDLGAAVGPVVQPRRPAARQPVRPRERHAAAPLDDHPATATFRRNGVAQFRIKAVR